MAKCYVFTPPNAGSVILTSTIYPNADGAIVEIPWGADNLPVTQGGWETTAGGGISSAGYNFTHFDLVINNQLTYGAAKVAVSLSPISFGGSNQCSPNYIFTSGYAVANSYTQLYTAAASDYLGSGAISPPGSAQGVDNTAFPAAWMPAFQNAWIAAFSAAINHMAAQSYASSIAYIRVGGGAGGEWFPFATAGLLTIPGGPTTVAALKTTWITGYMSPVESAILVLGSGFNFVQAMDGGFATENVPYNWCDTEAALANGNGFGIGGEGFKGNDIGAFTTHGTTSGGSNVSGYPSMDHAYVFNLYSSNPILQGQTSAASDPTGAVQPGSLVPLIPYMTARGTTEIELYYADWLVAYDPSNPQNATYGAAYQSAIQTARGLTVVNARNLQVMRESIVTITAGNPNVRDIQVNRETILQTNASARDYQVVRESILSYSPKVRNLQVMRESIIIVPVNVRDIQVMRESIVRIQSSLIQPQICVNT